MKIYLSSLSDSPYYISNYLTDKDLSNISEIIYNTDYYYFEIGKIGSEKQYIETVCKIDEYLKNNNINVKVESINKSIGIGKDFIFYV